jgi:hypothetical protein
MPLSKVFYYPAVLLVLIAISENRSHFKIKKGDIEIEYEGKSDEVTSKFSEIFEWIKTAPTTSPPSKEPVIPQEPEKEKPRRGGPRTGVISPAIDGLIKEGFLNDFKNASLVHEELRRKTVPVSGIKPVSNALNRKVPKILDRIKDEQDRWVYRKKPS